MYLVFLNYVGPNLVVVTGGVGVKLPPHEKTQGFKHCFVTNVVKFRFPQLTDPVECFLRLDPVGCVAVHWIQSRAPVDWV